MDKSDTTRRAGAAAPLGPRDTDDLWVNRQADMQNPAARRLTGAHHAFTYEEIAAYRASREDKTDRITLTIADPSDATWLGAVVLANHDEPSAGTPAFKPERKSTPPFRDAAMV